MDRYYVNTTAQRTGEHEVHKRGCRYFPVSFKSLGAFATCHQAVQAARTFYDNVDGCATCSPLCHTK